MKKLLSLLMLSICAACATTGDPAAAPLTLAPSEEAMPPMPQPTAQHMDLVASAGTYTGTLTSYEAGPEPLSTTCTETVEAIGSFWTRSTMTCEFMGMPYEGTGIVGYDEASGEYIGDWVDNMAPFYAFMRGKYLADGKTLRMRYSAPDWMSGEMVPHWIDTVKSENGYTSTFYRGQEDGEHQKAMTIEMTRSTN